MSLKVYFEAYVEAVGDVNEAFVGIESSAASIASGGGASMAGTWVYMFKGGIHVPWGGTAGHLLDNGTAYSPQNYSDVDHPVWRSFPSKIVPGDVIMVALDAAAKKLWFGKNGRWVFLGDPAKGETPTVSGFTIVRNSYYRDFRAVVGGLMGTAVTMNFGDQRWRYAPPAGFGGIPHRAVSVLDRRPVIDAD